MEGGAAELQVLPAIVRIVRGRISGAEAAKNLILAFVLLRLYEHPPSFNFGHVTSAPRPCMCVYPALGQPLDVILSETALLVRDLDLACR